MSQILPRMFRIRQEFPRQAPLDLPASTGARVQHVGKLPIGTFPAGTYQLRIAVSEGQQHLTRTAFFTLVD